MRIQIRPDIYLVLVVCSELRYMSQGTLKAKPCLKGQGGQLGRALSHSRMVTLEMTAGHADGTDPGNRCDSGKQLALEPLGSKPRDFKSHLR